jgi:transcriptional regulator with XRE-family HTH domain
MNSPIKELRENLKLKQVEMAREAGVSPAHISEVEHCLVNINSRMLKFLEENHFDVGKIREQQDACILEHENVVKANLKLFLVPKSNE